METRLKSWRSGNESETREIGRRLASLLEPDGTLLLTGDLGAGKTVLTQGIASGLGIDHREVQSPTYTLMREHEGHDGSLLHVDLYRLDPADVETVGLEERLAGPGVKVVEWAERIPFPVPGALRLAMRILEDGHVREIAEHAESEVNDVLESAADEPGR